MSTILSDLKAEVMKRDTGLDEALAKHQDCRLAINEIMYFREKLLDFLVSQLDPEKIEKIEFETAVDIIYKKYLEVMLQAMN